MGIFVVLRINVNEKTLNIPDKVSDEKNVLVLSWINCVLVLMLNVWVSSRPQHWGLGFRLRLARKGLGAIPAGNRKEIWSVKPALIIHSNFSSEGRDPASSNSEDDIWIKHNETPVHRIHGQIQLDGGSTVSCNAATSSKGYCIYTKCKKIKNLCHLSSNVLLQDNWRNKTKR